MIDKSKMRAGGGEKAPWMPKYGRDFYGDENVLAMSWEQRGVYDFLLWKAWDEGSIPADQAKLAAICGFTRGRFTKVWEGIALCWSEHPNKPGRLIQKRQERVRASSGELSRKMKELADRRWRDHEGALLASGANAKTDAGGAPEAREGDAAPHAVPQCEDACEPAPASAMRHAMLTTRQKTEARSTEDGRMDGGGGSYWENRDGHSSGSTQGVGELAASVLRGVAP